MEDQKNLIEDLENRDGESWLIFLDAGRADFFEELYPEYLEGEYKEVVSGVQSTPLWFRKMFRHEVDGHLFHAGQPIKGITGPNYDEDRWFDTIPSAALYDAYGEGLPFNTTDPASVNEVVEMHLSESGIVSERLRDLGYVPSGNEEIKFDMNVVRYLQPHTPYRSITDFGAHRNGFRDRIQEGVLDFEDLENAYEDNYRWGLEYASELVDILRERTDNVVVTADHGECLGRCGEWFHGSSSHDHLVNVPWLEVE